MNSFFAELKRRNVVRVAIAYVVVSWARRGQESGPMDKKDL